MFMKLALAGLLLASAPAVAEDDIVARHTARVGGAETLEAIDSVEIGLKITEPKFTVEGLYRANRQGQMRVDIFAGGKRVFTETLNGEEGWQMFGDGTIKDVGDAGRAALMHGIMGNIYGLHEYADFGAAVSVGEPTEMDGTFYIPVDITYADGFEERRLLNADTMLVERSMSEAALHPDVDPTKQRLVKSYMDFHTVNGLTRAFREEVHDMDTGELTQTVIVTSFSVNPNIDPAIFTRPEGKAEGKKE